MQSNWTKKGNITIICKVSHTFSRIRMNADLAIVATQPHFQKRSRSVNSLLTLRRFDLSKH